MSTRFGERKSLSHIIFYFVYLPIRIYGSWFIRMTRGNKNKKKTQQLICL